MGNRHFLKQSSKKGRKKPILNLKPGEVVEVRGESEIFATLDENCTLERLLFIPEMRKYCGRRYRVLKRVNKIIVEGIGMRLMKNTVILRGWNAVVKRMMNAEGLVCYFGRRPG